MIRSAAEQARRNTVEYDLQRREMMAAQNAAMGLTPHTSIAASKPDKVKKLLLLRRAI